MTKAERYRYAAERTNHKPAKPKKAAPLEQKLRAARTTEGLDGAGPAALHNFAPRGAHRSVYAFEGTTEKNRPSRKSTRASSQHIKTDSSIRRRIMKQIEGPSARHQRRSP